MTSLSVNDAGGGHVVSRTRSGCLDGVHAGRKAGMGRDPPGVKLEAHVHEQALFALQELTRGGSGTGLPSSRGSLEVISVAWAPTTTRAPRRHRGS